MHIKLSSLTDHTIRISSQTTYISTDHISCMSSQAGRWITPAAYQAKHSCGSHQSHIKPNKLYIYGSQQLNIKSNNLHTYGSHQLCTYQANQAYRSHHPDIKSTKLYIYGSHRLHSKSNNFTGHKTIYIPTDPTSRICFRSLSAMQPAV